MAPCWRLGQKCMDAATPCHIPSPDRIWVGSASRKDTSGLPTRPKGHQAPNRHEEVDPLSAIHLNCWRPRLLTHLPELDQGTCAMALVAHQGRLSPCRLELGKKHFSLSPTPLQDFNTGNPAFGSRPWAGACSVCTTGAPKR